MFINYFKKFFGINNGSRVPPCPKIYALVWSFFGAFFGIAAVIGISTYTVLADEDMIPAVMGSIGAIAILIYGSIDVALAQPRNLVFGNVFSAIVGILVEMVFVKITGSSTSLLWLKAALAVSIALVVMQVTRTVHPPAGATALIAVAGGKNFYEMGFLYLAIPVLFSVSIMLFIALIINNIQRQYPLYWFNPDLDIKKEIEYLFSRNKKDSNLTQFVNENIVDELDYEIDFKSKMELDKEHVTTSATVTLEINELRPELEILRLKDELLKANERIKELENNYNKESK